LVFTEDKIARLPLTQYYFAKIESGEQDVEVFRDYMEKNGWKQTHQTSEMHIFEKNGNEVEIINTQVKTLIIDGSLNLQYLNQIF